MKEATQNTQALLKQLKGDDLRKALLPAARIFYAGAYRRCPYDPGRKKGTHLRDALFIDTRKHGFEHQTDVLVGINNKKAPHWHLMEYGWSKSPSGHPFMRPTAFEEGDRIRGAVAEAVKETVKDTPIRKTAA